MTGGHYFGFRSRPRASARSRRPAANSKLSIPYVSPEAAAGHIRLSCGSRDLRWSHRCAKPRSVELHVELQNFVALQASGLPSAEVSVIWAPMRPARRCSAAHQALAASRRTVLSLPVAPMSNRFSCAGLLRSFARKVHEFRHVLSTVCG